MSSKKHLLRNKQAIQTVCFFSIKQCFYMKILYYVLKYPEYSGDTPDSPSALRSAEWKKALNQLHGILHNTENETD